MDWQVGTIILWLSILNLTSGQGQCYFPPATEGQLGYQATEQKPCDAFAEVTLCCPLGWTCFSNKMCVVTDSSAVGDMWPLGTALRGTCTNPEWDDTTCGDFCLNDPVLQNNGSLQYCGDGNWCCGPAAADGSCDCQSKKGIFSIPDGNAQTIIGVTGMESTSTFFTPAFTSSVATQTTSTLVTSTSRSSSSSPTTSLTTSSSPSSKSSIKSSTSDNQSKTSSPTSSHASTTSQAMPTAVGAQNSMSITQKTGFKAGMGVLGAVAGLAIIGLLVFIIWRHKRKARLANLPTADDDSSIYPPPPASPPPMVRTDPDPYAYAIPPRSLARGAPGGAGNGTQMRAFRGSNRMSRSPPPMVDPYIMPYEGT